MDKTNKYWAGWAKCLQEDLPLLARMEYFMHKYSGHSTGGYAMGFRYNLEGAGSKSFIEGMINELNTAAKNMVICQASVILCKVGGKRASRMWRVKGSLQPVTLDGAEADFLVKYFAKKQKGLQLVVFTSPSLSGHWKDPKGNNVVGGVSVDKYLIDCSIY